eukprot:1302937-Lingulodinium_polyedra.AAC.1
MPRRSKLKINDGLILRAKIWMQKSETEDYVPQPEDICARPRAAAPDCIRVRDVLHLAFEAVHVHAQ